MALHTQSITYFNDIVGTMISLPSSSFISIHILQFLNGFAVKTGPNKKTSYIALWSRDHEFDSQKFLIFVVNPFCTIPSTSLNKNLQTLQNKQKQNKTITTKLKTIQKFPKHITKNSEIELFKKFQVSYVLLNETINSKCKQVI